MAPALTAVLLEGAEAAGAIADIWDAGEAVLPLDPAAPAAETAWLLARMRPTHVLDVSGRSGRAGGVPVEEGVAAVVVTSGTTGEPKGVELSFEAMTASAQAVSAALEVGPKDRWLCCLPLRAIAGLAILARARTSGIPVTVQRRFHPAAVAEAGDASLVSLVPTALARLLEAGVDVSRFRRLLLGGGPIPEPLLEAGAAAGAHVVTTYGMTETGGGVVHDGHPLPGVELAIADDGEILVRGPVLMERYRFQPDETAAALAGGWLHTGDVGRVEKGRLQVVDRRRDIVISGGVNVSPAEVELVLARHPAVADVAVAGVPDAHWGERVVAYVVAADPSRPPGLAELRSFAARSLSPPKLPRQLMLVTDIPRTAGGKPRRHLLAGQAAGGVADPATAVPPLAPPANPVEK